MHYIFFLFGLELTLKKINANYFIQVDSLFYLRLSVMSEHMRLYKGDQRENFIVFMPEKPC